MSSEQSQAVAQRLEELRLPLNPNVSYNLETVFPRISGWGAKGEIKRKHRLLRLVEDRLEQMLRPGEEVLYVAKGVQYKFIEQYFLGVWAMSINQTVFVLTNVRLLMLHTNGKGKPKNTFWMIYYSQIEQFKATWHGTFVVKLRDKMLLKFTGFPKRDKKEMPRVFQQALDTYRERGFDPEVTQSRENLCTYCLERVPKDEYTCSACGAEFWTPKQIALRSLIFPSWGDFLMGHTAVAAVELLGYLFVWFVIVSAITAAPNNPGGMPESLIVAATLLFFAHVPDAWLTYYIAKKGLHPRKGPVAETELSAEAAGTLSPVE